MPNDAEPKPFHKSRIEDYVLSSRFRWGICFFSLIAGVSVGVALYFTSESTGLMLLAIAGGSTALGPAAIFGLSTTIGILLLGFVVYKLFSRINSRINTSSFPHGLDTADVEPEPLPPATMAYGDELSLQQRIAISELPPSQDTKKRSALEIFTPAKTPRGYELSPQQRTAIQVLSSDDLCKLKKMVTPTKRNEYLNRTAIEPLQEAFPLLQFGQNSNLDMIRSAVERAYSARVKSLSGMLKELSINDLCRLKCIVTSPEFTSERRPQGEYSDRDAFIEDLQKAFPRLQFGEEINPDIILSAVEHEYTSRSLTILKNKGSESVFNMLAEFSPVHGSSLPGSEEDPLKPSF